MRTIKPFSVVGYIALFIAMACSVLAEDEKLTSQISFRGTVDVATLKIQDGKVWLENGPFSPPTKISIMGRRWEPKWTGNKSDTFSDFKKPLKPLAKATAKLDVLHGRSIVNIKEQPSEANQWTLIIEIHDVPNDADEYTLRISW